MRFRVLFLLALPCACAHRMPGDPLLLGMTPSRSADFGSGFRLVTWNIHQGFGHDQDGRPEQWPEMKESVVALGPDIVLLQETVSGLDTNWATEVVHHGEELASRLGGFAAFGGQVRSGTAYPTLNARVAGMFGNATVSMRPIAAVSTFPLSDNRTALVTEIDGVTIANVHFTAEDHDKTLAEARELLSMLPSGPTVIAGDFNERLGTPTMGELLDAGFRPCTLESNVDNVLVSDGFACVDTRIIGDRLSDHPRIVTEVVWVAGE